MVLVFDCGTTNTKAFLFDEKGKIVAYSNHQTKIIHQAPKIVEQKADFWWDALVRAMEKLKRFYKWKKNEISCLSISSQGATFVLLDKKFLTLRPGITWLDNRAEPISKYLNRIYGREYFSERQVVILVDGLLRLYLSGLKEKSQELYLK